jgi:hypothetical protein
MFAFAKGFVGTGTTSAGHMNDEDFVLHEERPDGTVTPRGSLYECSAGWRCGRGMPRSAGPTTAKGGWVANPSPNNVRLDTERIGVLGEVNYTFD